MGQSITVVNMDTRISSFLVFLTLGLINPTSACEISEEVHVWGSYNVSIMTELGAAIWNHEDTDLIYEKIGSGCDVNDASAYLVQKNNWTDYNGETIEYNVTYTNYSLLHLAVMSGNTEALKILVANSDIQLNATTTVLGITPLTGAIYFSDMIGDSTLDSIGVLVEAGVEINQRYDGVFNRTHGYTSLHFAAESAGADVAEKLVELGADLEAIEYTYTETPIFNAIGQNNIEVLEYIIQAGADVNYVAGGFSPLDAAQAFKNYEMIDDEIIDLLTEAGAEYNAYTEYM